MGNDFAVFIMVHGRPDKMWTYQQLRDKGYTGKIFLVADDLDPTMPEYKKKYGDELLVFDKKKAALTVEAGDNSGDLRSTLFSASTIPDLARENGIKYFFIMCDDYTAFRYKFGQDLKYNEKRINDLDAVFAILLKFYKSTSALTLAFAQGGDYIGGENSNWATRIRLHRKAMNTFLCSTDRSFKFLGRLNEDVTTYVNMGSRGHLFFTVPQVSIFQLQTQKNAGGLSEVYLQYGTYVKSFFSVMYNPSSVKVAMMGDQHPRIHHRVKWNHAVPKIMSEKYKK